MKKDNILHKMDKFIHVGMVSSYMMLCEHKSYGEIIELQTEKGVKTNAAGYYIDTKGNKIEGLTPGEKANFIDAVVNVKNDDFHLETSNQILKERLLKEVEEEHTEHWRKKNEEKARLEAEQTRRFNLQNVEKTPSQYGYRTQEMMQKEYNAIKSGEIGDEIPVILDGVYYTFTRMNDGNFEHIGENNKSTIKTPNQIANLRDLIGFDRIPNPKGTNPFTMTTNFPVKSKEK